MDKNRKTNIPVKGIPQIVEWLVDNCSPEELDFMEGLAGDRKNFTLLNSIFTRLTDFNIYEVFYNSKINTGEDLMIFRAAKRGEVAGLKAFSMACQAARLKRQEKQTKRKEGKREKKEDE